MAENSAQKGAASRESTDKATDTSAQKMDRTSENAVAPKILAIESSGSICSVALTQAQKLVAEVHYHTPNVHDRLLARSVQRLTQDCGWNIAEIDCLAVSAGPGSFTGLRIGAALAKSLCIENQPKLVAVPTAHSLAHQAQTLARALGSEEARTKICTLIPSHRDLVYTQMFTDLAEATDELSLVPKSLIAEQFDASILYCGPAMPLAELPQAVHFPKVNILSATAVAQVGAQLFAAGNTVSAELYEPLYAQEFQPKVSQKKL